MNPWITLAVGLLTLAGALTVADLATAQARLRRRLDKELAILARLEVPGPKERLAVIVERHSWELVHRAEEEPHHNRWLFLAFISLGTVINVLVGIRMHAVNPSPSDDVLATSWMGLLPMLGILVTSVSALVSEGRNRRKFIAEKMAPEDSPAGEPIHPAP